MSILRKNNAVVRAGFLLRNAHGVERTIDKYQRDNEEEGPDADLQLSVLHRDGDLRGQQSEQSRELDHWIERDRRRVFEWIADGVADYSGGMQFGAFLAEIDFNNLLGVVPGA